MRALPWGKLPASATESWYFGPGREAHFEVNAIYKTEILSTCVALRPTASGLALCWQWTECSTVAFRPRFPRLGLTKALANLAGFPLNGRR